jgi:tartrate dehydratase beta subunit/fumarate hydratase class I family protein
VTQAKGAVMREVNLNQMIQAVKELSLKANFELGEDVLSLWKRASAGRIEVKNFPVAVANDTHGGDLYEEGAKQYARP